MARLNQLIARLAGDADRELHSPADGSAGYLCPDEPGTDHEEMISLDQLASYAQGVLERAERVQAIGLIRKAPGSDTGGQVSASRAGCQSPASSCVDNSGRS
jgi:hypothetical protein